VPKQIALSISMRSLENTRVLFSALNMPTMGHVSRMRVEYVQNSDVGGGGPSESLFGSQRII
jgi:hypothetical protein